MLLSWMSLQPIAAAAFEPALEFRLAGKAASRFTLSELQGKLKSYSIRFFNPFAGKGKEKNYKAFKIMDVLDLAYGDPWKKDEYSDMAFIALDGYEAVGKLALLKEEGGYLAFKDLDVPLGWEPVGKRNADPGPFFLVWTKENQTTVNAYPWPFQVAALNLVRFEDAYPSVVPAAPKDSPAYRGFLTFKARCIRCHSINQEGGKIGPDLNAPQSVSAYRSKRMIKEFIRHPSKYRHTQMPDHEDLSDENLEELYRYFRLKGKDSAKSAW